MCVCKLYWKKFHHTFLRNYKAYKVETWYTIGQWADASCIPESGCSYLLIPLFFSFFFLSNFQTKVFITLFSGTVRPRRLKLGIHVDSRQMNRVYRNKAAAAYLSLYFFIFLSLEFSNIKVFRHTFLRNCEASKIETWYTCGQWANVSCISESGCCCIFVPLFHFPFSNFQTLKFFVTLFSEL